MLPRVRHFAHECGAALIVTERPQHAGDLTRQALADGCERVVAVGGDGTLNEVAAALLDSPAVLGLIPCGSGNGLGRNLGIHGPGDRAFSALRTGKVRTIDTGVADGHPFFTVAGLGFEAEIAERFNRLTRRGFHRYLLASATAFRAYRPLEYTIEHDGQRESWRAFTIAVANSDQYGNNARIAPGARPDDGLLNLTIVPPISPFNAAPLFCRLFTGGLSAMPGITLRVGTRFVVERPAPGPIHTDGEIRHAGRRVEFHVRPNTLRVLVPRL